MGVTRDTSADAAEALTGGSAPSASPSTICHDAAATLFVGRYTLQRAIEDSEAVLQRYARHTKIAHREKAAIAEALAWSKRARELLAEADAAQRNAEGQ